MSLSRYITRLSNTTDARDLARALAEIFRNYKPDAWRGEYLIHADLTIEANYCRIFSGELQIAGEAAIAGELHIL